MAAAQAGLSLFVAGMHGAPQSESGAQGTARQRGNFVCAGVVLQYLHKRPSAIQHFPQVSLGLDAAQDEHSGKVERHEDVAHGALLIDALGSVARHIVQEVWVEAHAWHKPEARSSAVVCVGQPMTQASAWAWVFFVRVTHAEHLRGQSSELYQLHSPTWQALWRSHVAVAHFAVPVVPRLCERCVLLGTVGSSAQHAALRHGGRSAGGARAALAPRGASRGGASDVGGRRGRGGLSRKRT
eukprot:9503816-Pyramimonas_sp.AAC.2